MNVEGRHSDENTGLKSRRIVSDAWALTAIAAVAVTGVAALVVLGV